MVVAACSSGDAPSPTNRLWRITIDPVEALIDVPVEIEVTGGETGDEITLRATMGAARSSATFVVGVDGRVVTSRDAPVSGDYDGVDAMGLFWSLPADSFPRRAAPPGEATRRLVTITVVHDEVDVASAEVTRRMHEPLQEIVASPSLDGGVAGMLFSPLTGCPCPTVLVLGGSEGGITASQWTARLLASHGLAVMAVAYFGVPGKPEELVEIPVEDVSAAVDWALQQEPAREPVAVMGYSRGSELALDAAAQDARLAAVVVSSPSNVRWPAPPPASGPSWTLGGVPLPFIESSTVEGVDVDEVEAGVYRSAFEAALDDAGPNAPAAIAVEQIRGPILVGSGVDDQLWPSDVMADAIVARLASVGHPFEVVQQTYPAAGHAPFVPGVPTVHRSIRGIALGGTPAAQANAAVEWWGHVLRFLDRHLCSTPSC